MFQSSVHSQALPPRSDWPHRPSPFGDFVPTLRKPQLPPQYTPFGKVVQGLSILKKIAAAGSDNSNGPGDGKPKQPVVIESFTVAKG